MDHRHGIWMRTVFGCVCWQKLRLLVGIVMVLLVLGNFGYFWHTYTTHYKKNILANGSMDTVRQFNMPRVSKMIMTLLS